MKKNTLGRIVIAALSFSMLLLSADDVSAQRGGGHASYHFGGGAHIGSGYYAPRSSYHYVAPGYGATKIYHPVYSRVVLGGVNYGYYNGMFYRPYGFGLHLIFPPIGITVGMLPYGYYPFYWGANPYFYYGGVFYDPYVNGGYQVVTPPLGALVPELPAGVQTQTVNGQVFYEYYGTFYQKEVHSNGEVWFKVVGVNGKLETGNPQYDQQYQPVQPPATDQAPTGPVAGDLLNKLPDGCTAVNIGGEQYFKAPDGTYYQEVIGQDNKVMYQMVDKSTLPQQTAPSTPNQ